MSISSLKNANSDLIISALNVAILLAPITAAMPETLEDPTTGDLIELPDFTSVGLTEKSSGTNFGQEVTSTDIESHGEAEPTKKIISKRTGSTDFVMQESNRQALELVNAADYSDVVPSAHGGVVLPTPGRPNIIYYRGIILGEDGSEGNEIYPYWLLPRVALTNVANQSLSDTGAITYHPTITWFKDKNFLIPGGTASAQGFCGPGWQSLVAAAGFGTSVSKTVTVTGSPTGGTFTVTVDSKVTGALPYNITAGQLQSALEGLTSVGEGFVTVTGTAGAGFAVVFKKAVTTVTATASLTGGTSPGVTVA